MEGLKELVPTTPPFTTVQNQRSEVTRYTTKSTRQNKAHPKHHAHKYNTRAAKEYDEATIPRVTIANAAQPDTSVSIHEVFPAKAGFSSTPHKHRPRVASCNNAINIDNNTGSIPMELQAQWLENSVVEDTTGELLEYRHLIRHDKYKQLWEAGMCRELGQLSQGFVETKGTSTIFFIPRSKVPAGRKVTYMTIVCTEKPSKSDSERVRLCVGGDRLEFDGNIITPTADLTTVKILLNSTISTKDARFMTMDIKFFTWAPRWTYTNMEDSISVTYPSRSHRNTNWKLCLTGMGMSTWRSRGECTG